MLRSDVITLVREAADAHGVYERPYETEREVYVTVEGVGMTEMYTAMAQGFRPEVKFRLEIAEDYDREREVIWNGDRYTVIRTQLDREGGDGITLVCQRGVQRDG